MAGKLIRLPEKGGIDIQAKLKPPSIRICVHHQKRLKLEGTRDLNPNPPPCQISAIGCPHPGIVLIKISEQKKFTQQSTE